MGISNRVQAVLVGVSDKAHGGVLALRCRLVSLEKLRLSKLGSDSSHNCLNKLLLQRIKER